MNFILPYIEKLPYIPDQYNTLIAQLIAAVLFVFILYVLARVSSWFFNKYLGKLVARFNSGKWFNAMAEHRFFTAVGVVVAALAAINLYPVFITKEVAWLTTLMGKLTGFFIVLSFAWLINSVLDTLGRLYGRNPNIPIKGLVQALKIILFLITGLFILSLLLGRRPMYIITGLSALAAVFSLIFKDPILGFAASIQLTTNKLIKIGDWITVDSAGADGNIIDISLTSVRVQNFDMTIVSVPTYDMISKPFKNWSGMYQAKARRIQRSILIDVDTVKFLDRPMLERLKKIQLLKDYLEQKEAEINAPYISYSGALASDFDSTPLGSIALSKETALKAKRYINRFYPDIECSTYSDDRWITDDDTTPLINAERAIIKRDPEKGDLSRLLSNDDPVHKLLCIGDAKRLDSLRLDLISLFPECRIYKSQPRYLEVMSKDACKSTAAALLCERLGIKAKDVLAFGDNYNDTDLLEFAGTGVAMGNAPDDVKSVADEIADTNDNDGLSKYIERLLGF